MEVNTTKLMEMYLDTLQKCGLFLLNEVEEVIEYNIFEEFDIGVVTFLHEDNLKILFESGLINKEILEKSSELRKMVLNLQRSDQWNLEAVKFSCTWKRVLELSDHIKEMIQLNDHKND